MKMPIQYSLFKNDLQNYRRFFGGALLKGKRKSLRPLSTKEPIHLVMRSPWAKGNYSFLRPHNKAAIERLVNIMAAKFNIKVYRLAIQGNHIHFIIKISHRVHYKAFVKALSGKIATHVMTAPSFDLFLERLGAGTKRGDGLKKGEKPKGFWEFRPFSRVLYWGKDFKRCCEYLAQNALEAIGFIAYSPRKNHYAKWLVALSP